MTSNFKHAIILDRDYIEHLAPFFDAHICPKSVILIYHEEIRDSAEWLSRWLYERGIPSSLWKINSHLSNVQIARYLLQRLQDESTPIALNLGGNQSILAAIAHSIFRGLSKPVFLCDSNTMFRLEGGFKVHQIKPNWSIEPLLSYFGLSVLKSDTQNELMNQQSHVSSQLLHHIEQTQPFRILQRYAQEAKTTLRSPQIKGGELMVPGFQTLLELLENEGHVFLDRGILLFQEERFRRFCTGDWLSTAFYDHYFTTLDDVELLGVQLEVSWRDHPAHSFDLSAVLFIQGTLTLIAVTPSEDSKTHLYFDMLSRCIQTLPCKVITLSMEPLCSELEQRVKDLKFQHYSCNDIKTLV